MSFLLMALKNFAPGDIFLSVSSLSLVSFSKDFHKPSMADSCDRLFFVEPLRSVVGEALSLQILSVVFVTGTNADTHSISAEKTHKQIARMLSCFKVNFITRYDPLDLVNEC